MSIWALVKPHATRPLLPTTTAGVPGSVTPTTCRVPPGAPGSGQRSTARNQMCGTRRPRCMSSASRAPPWEVCAAATAQLLLPAIRSLVGRARGSLPGDGAGGGHGPQVDDLGAGRRWDGHRRVRRSGRPTRCPPGSGRPPGRVAAASSTRPWVDSWAPSVSWSSMNMASSTSGVSSSRHGAGVLRRRRYSQGRAASPESPALTPSVYALTRALLGLGAHLPRPGGRRRAGGAAGCVRSVSTDGRPQQLGQLTGRQPAQQVHLEEALLSVDEAEGARGVEAVAGLHGGRPESIPLHRHRPGEPARRTCPSRRGRLARSCRVTQTPAPRAPTIATSRAPRPSRTSRRGHRRRGREGSMRVCGGPGRGQGGAHGRILPELMQASARASPGFSGGDDLSDAAQMSAEHLTSVSDKY